MNKILLFFITITIGCSKDDLQLNKTSQSYKNNNDSISKLEENVSSSFKQTYDEYACTVPNTLEPGKMCVRGLGSTCSGPSGCISILGKYPNSTKEEIMKIWNRLPKLKTE